MWLVLCHPDDHAALWAYTALKARGLAPLRLVCPQALACATHVVHRIDAHGARFELSLADGSTLASKQIRGVLNRMSSLPVAHLGPADDVDSRYAAEELSALALSWLSCISPVMVNRPSPRGLPGAWRPAAQWAVLAAQAGLAVSAVPLYSPGLHPRPLAPARVVVVAAGTAYGAPAPEAVMRACVQLADAAELDLLSVGFHVEPDGTWRFAHADPLPDLRLGGQALIGRLHDHLLNLPWSPS
ncbi:hypothetical protein [Catellatospora chokoriensis]|uniref:Uncharacterized protein n=1 Tax=Catellatospora chokoriensis TaxID=310353 RepID=A0A8J3KDT9_9ACTN|nr:hypothetical protein [Catellatospora chokoriensis]GIF94129.1 hypothetical protein Cch02nite_75730 [Catellatospora chokoriensis]